MGIETKEDKEESKMSNQDVQSEVAKELDRKAMKDDIGAIKANQEEISDLCKLIPGLCDEIKALKEAKPDENNQTELANGVKNLTNMICDPVTGKCVVVTKDEFKELEEKIPQIYGGHHDLNSLFRKLAEGGNEKFDKAIQARIPASLKVKWVQEWCKDGECKPLLKEAGITVHDDEEPRRGAFPGSVR